jgi:putative tricarboxylic transport membrane protein
LEIGGPENILGSPIAMTILLISLAAVTLPPVIARLRARRAARRADSTSSKPPDQPLEQKETTIP